MQQEPTQSAFLRLPTELRLKIYIHALAGRVIHIYRPAHIGSWGYWICLSDRGFDAYKTWNRWQTSGPTLTPCESKMGLRCRRVALEQGTSCLTDEKLSLGLLLANKQIHGEARLIPFKENIFHFDDSEAYYAFSNFESNDPKALSDDQIGAIRNVAITNQPRGSWDQGWCYAPNPSADEPFALVLGRMLPNVTSIHVNIRALVSLEYQDGSEGVTERIQTLLQTHRIFPIFSFAVMSLTRVEVVVAASSVSGKGDEDPDELVQEELEIDEVWRDFKEQELRDYLLRKWCKESQDWLKQQSELYARDFDKEMGDGCCIQ